MINTTWALCTNRAPNGDLVWLCALSPQKAEEVCFGLEWSGKSSLRKLNLNWLKRQYLLREEGDSSPVWGKDSESWFRGSDAPGRMKKPDSTGGWGEMGMFQESRRKPGEHEARLQTQDFALNKMMVVRYGEWWFRNMIWELCGQRIRVKHRSRELIQSLRQIVTGEKVVEMGYRDR